MTSAVDGVAADIEVMPVTEFWDREYLVYADYTVSDRAVPFADSGLKPVQQRIMYAASVTGAVPAGDAPKTQKLASTVSGDYHPHGDASVADTISLMAAHYQRTKLLEGKGAFPVAVGETPASPRYTHAKLSVPGYEMVRDLREGDVVDFSPTYDERLTEPVTLPSRFPALLVYGVPKGSIAVGWASAVPAHNPREVIDAARALLDDPGMSDDELCGLLPGPDWGSGGKVVGTGGIRDYITTGRGLLTVSGAADIHGKEIRITQLPPGVPIYTEASGKSAPGGLVGSIRAAALHKKISGIDDVANLSDFAGVNITVTCKRGHRPEDVLEQLREMTLFETTFGVQIIALDDDRVPRIWTVRELLEQFLAMRDRVVLQRSRIRLDRAVQRQKRVQGLLAIQVDIDTAVAIIRDSDTDGEVVSKLMTRFEVDEEQAVYVMEQKLRVLKRSDELKLAKENEELSREISRLEKLVSSKSARRKAVSADLTETAKVFSGTEFDRRTLIDPEAAPAKRRNGTNGSSGSSRDGNLNPKWRIDDRGMFSDSHGEPLSGGLAWAVWADGRVKLTDGKGLPTRLKDVPVAPDIGDLVASGIIGPDQDMLLVTRHGRGLRLQQDKTPTQGIAGNGVAGAKLTDEKDAVIAAFPVTDVSAVLTVSEKGHKVTAVSGINPKGRGSQGMGIHPLLPKETGGVLEAHVSTTGFIIGGKPAKAVKPATTPARSDLGEWSRG